MCVENVPATAQALFSSSSSSLWINYVGQELQATVIQACKFHFLNSGTSFTKPSPPSNLHHIESSMATQQYSTPYAGKRVSLGDPEREFPIADAAGSAA